MRAYVFTDSALARHARRFVWLDINTDLPENAAFLEKYPVEIWPTLFILDPREEKALVRFVGSATVEQLTKLFEDGERAYRGGAQGAEALLARGDSLYGEGHAAEAAEAFARALAEAPPDWSRRGRTLESLLMALMQADKPEECARTALAELPRVPRSSSWANATSVGLSCALSVQGSSAAELRTALEARAHEALAPPAIEMAADDRSGLYEVLVQARKAAEDKAGARALAEQWLTYLEDEAARARTAEERTVFDWHRVSAAMQLGDPARALPALQQSERDLPEDYNPPARLAGLYRRMGRLDEALAASDRALSKVQGARRLRVLAEHAEIHLARGDRGAAVRALKEALTYARGFSKAQVSERQVAALEKKLAQLEGQ